MVMVYAAVLVDHFFLVTLTEWQAPLKGIDSRGMSNSPDLSWTKFIEWNWKHGIWFCKRYLAVYSIRHIAYILLIVILDSHQRIDSDGYWLGVGLTIWPCARADGVNNSCETSLPGTSAWSQLQWRQGGVDWWPVVETQCEKVLVHLVFEFTSIVVFLSNKLFKCRCGWLLHGHVVASVEDRKVGNLLDQCFLFAEKLLSWSALVHHRWWASWWQFGFFAPGGKGSSFDGGSGWFVAVRGGSWSKR